MYFDEVQVGDVVMFEGIEATVVGIYKKNQSILLGWTDKKSVCWNLKSPGSEGDLALCDDKVSNIDQYNWAYWVSPGDILLLRRPARTVAVVSYADLHCSKCHDHFPFSEPNQADGKTLICWNCRNYPHYRSRM